jgi:hypothetical protein
MLWPTIKAFEADADELRRLIGALPTFDQLIAYAERKR